MEKDAFWIACDKTFKIPWKYDVNNCLHSLFPLEMECLIEIRFPRGTIMLFNYILLLLDDLEIY